MPSSARIIWLLIGKTLYDYRSFHYDSNHPCNRIDVPLDKIEDWHIALFDGKMKGAYSQIALFKHRENSGKKLNRTMRKQKAQLIDAEQTMM